MKTHLKIFFLFTLFLTATGFGHSNTSTMESLKGMELHESRTIFIKKSNGGHLVERITVVKVPGGYMYTHYKVATFATEWNPVQSSVFVPEVKAP